MLGGPGHLESSRRAEQRGLRLRVVGIGGQSLLGSLPGATRAVDVDVVGELGDVRQDDHAVVRDLDEPAVHCRGLLALLREQDPYDTDPERAEERHVPGQERDLTLRRPAHDHVAVARVQHPLGRDDVDGERHARSALFQRLRLREDGLDAAHVEERLLGHLVELAVHERFEALDGLLDRDVDALDAGELLAHEERL